jgi:signal transduction histidine kinase
MLPFMRDGSFTDAVVGLSVGAAPSGDTAYLHGMELLVGVAQELSLARQVETIQAIVRRAARELSGAEGATFVLREGDQCYYADEDAIAPLWKGLRFPITSCISGWVMLNARSVVIEDIYADARIRADAYRPTFVKSLAMLPIRTQNPIGAIGTYWSTRHTPSPSTLRLLQALADTTSIALENVRLYGELQLRVRESSAALALAQRAESAARRELAERERAQAALRRNEEQLHRVHKLEAVARLAASVAHDFNNFLSVILSYGSLVSSQLKHDDPVRSDVEEIRRAGQRAATLTGQLLAFSRQQLLAPRTLDLNEVVDGMGKMLERSSGAAVQFELHKSPEPQPVFADPDQLEQVLVNLVANARDAMPAGGTLSLACTRVDVKDTGDPPLGLLPGRYAALTISDTGLGMSEETQARIFEPFFTTKDKARGTGLGLSTVYGIVHQSGGHVTVTSEPARGTTFTIYLPSSLGPSPG